MILKIALIFNLYFSYLITKNKIAVSRPQTTTSNDSSALAISSLLLTQRLLSRILVLIIIFYIIFIFNFYSFSFSNSLFSYSIYFYNGLIVFTPTNFKIKLVLLFLFLIFIKVFSEYYKVQFITEIYLLLFANFIAILFILTSNDFIIFIISFELFNFSTYLLIASVFQSSSLTHFNPLTHSNPGSFNPSMASQGLIMSNNNLSSLAATINYFFLSSLVTAFLFLSILFFYYFTGSTNFDDIAFYIDYFLLDSTNILFLKLAIFFLISTLLFKLAAVPLHFYAPDLYNSMPITITKYLKTLPKILYIYLLYNFYTLFSFSQIPFISDLLLLAGVLSLLIGSIALVAQFQIKRFLAYSSIANLGYLLLAFQQSLDLSSILIYLISYFISLFAIFIVFIYLSLLFKKDINTFSSITSLTSLSTSSRSGNSFNFAISFILAIHFFALLGLPPLHGFFTKNLILLSYIVNHAYFIVFIMILGTLFNAAFYLSFITNIFKSSSRSSLFHLNSSIFPSFLPAGTPFKYLILIFFTFFPVLFVFKPLLLLQLFI